MAGGGGGGGGGGERGTDESYASRQCMTTSFPNSAGKRTGPSSASTQHVTVSGTDSRLISWMKVCKSQQKRKSFSLPRKKPAIRYHIVNDSVLDKSVQHATPDMVTNLQLIHHLCSQVRKRRCQLDLLEEVLR